MRVRFKLLLVGLAALIPLQVSAKELTARQVDIVEPDAELAGTVAELRSLVAGGEANIAKLERFFAGRVKTFQRGLDPFQPWKSSEVLETGYLQGMADMMIEQGAPEVSAPQPDYRIEAAKLLAAMLDTKVRFGTLDKAPGEICAPAAYKVNRKAALAFAGKFDVDAYSLRFYDAKVILSHAPNSVSGKAVPRNTLMVFDYDPKAPEGWGRYVTAGGVAGYMQDRDDGLGLAQNHVCFGKVEGRYRITTLFGYGQ